MATLILLALLAGALLSLVAALIYLYRFLVRKGLFPQLPRLWRGDRTRFLICAGGFVAFAAALVVVMGHPAAPPAPPGAPAGQQGRQAEPGMSNSQAARPQTAAEAGNERVLPPAEPTPPEPEPGLPSQPLGREEPPAPAEPAAPAAPAAPEPTAPPAFTPPTLEPPTPTAPPPPPEPPAAAPAPEKPAAPAAQPETAAPKGWLVCVASFRTPGEAESFAKGLRQKKLPVVVYQTKVKNKGLWHRVCLGPFPSQDKATVAAKGWKAKGDIANYFLVHQR